MPPRRGGAEGADGLAIVDNYGDLELYEARRDKERHIVYLVQRFTLALSWSALLGNAMGTFSVHREC